jgi:hypothetical protein
MIFNRTRHAVWCVAAGIAIGISALVVAEEKAAEKGLTQLKSGEAVTTASGLKVTMTTEAKEPGAKAGDVVWVHYTGKLQPTTSSSTHPSAESRSS